MTENRNPEITTNWRSTGEPSAAWRRLWDKLLVNRKDKPASTRRDSDDGELRNESEPIVPDK